MPANFGSPAITAPLTAFQTIPGASGPVPTGVTLRATSFEHVLEEKNLQQYEADETVYLINYQISLPGVRRELAGVEWLPRGRQQAFD